jgi:hypothetical protein
MFYLLTSFYIDHSENQRTWFLAFKYIIQFWVRNWFPVAFIMVFGICFLFWWGSGPLFEFSYNKFVWNQRCEEYWWAPLFFISSVYPNSATNECFNWLWFISCEFICFIILCLIFEIYRWSIKLALISCVALFSLSFIINAVLTFWVNPKITVMNIEQIRTQLLFRPYNMGFNYFMGVLAAILHFSYWNRRDIKFRLNFWVQTMIFVKSSNKIRWAGYIIALILLFLFKTFEYLIINYIGDENSGVSIAYIISTKFVNCIIILLFFIPILAGKAKYLRRLLQASVIRPFARISIGCYLLHGLILMWYIFSRK